MHVRGPCFSPLKHSRRSEALSRKALVGSTAIRSRSCVRPLSAGTDVGFAASSTPYAAVSFTAHRISHAPPPPSALPMCSPPMLSPTQRTEEIHAIALHRVADLLTRKPHLPGVFGRWEAKQLPHCEPLRRVVSNKAETEARTEKKKVTDIEKAIGRDADENKQQHSKESEYGGVGAHVSPLAPPAFVPRVRALLLQLVLSSADPLTAEEVVRTLCGHTAEIHDHHRCQVSSSLVDNLTVRTAAEIDYAVALHRLKTSHASITHSTGSSSSSSGCAGGVALEKKTLSGSLVGALQEALKADADANALALKLARAALFDAHANVCTVTALAYESLYAQSAASLIDATVRSSIDASWQQGTTDTRCKPIGFWSEWDVLSWLPVSLLLADPHLRISPHGGIVCAPVQPSVLMAAMDPVQLPSLRAISLSGNKARNSLTKGVDCTLETPIHAITTPQDAHSSPFPTASSCATSAGANPSVEPLADVLPGVVQPSHAQSCWPFAASLSHATDATRALTRGFPLPRRARGQTRGTNRKRSHSRDPTQRVQDSDMSDGVARALVQHWAELIAAGCGDATSTLEECLACVPRGVLPTRSSKPATATMSSAPTAARAHASAPDTAPLPLSSSTVKVAAVAPQRTGIAVNHDKQKRHLLSGSRSRSADGSDNEWARRATGWNEGVVGNPHLSAWITAATGYVAPGTRHDSRRDENGEGGGETHAIGRTDEVLRTDKEGVTVTSSTGTRSGAPTVTAARTAAVPSPGSSSQRAGPPPAASTAQHPIFSCLNHIAMHPEVQSISTVMEVNRSILQPLLEPMLVAPLSVARLATTLRWHATLPAAKYYHNSLLYFLLLYAANPTVCRTQLRDEAEIAVLSPARSPLLAPLSHSQLNAVPSHKKEPLPSPTLSAAWAGRRRLLAVLSTASDDGCGGSTAQRLAESEVRLLASQALQMPRDGLLSSCESTLLSTAAARPKNLIRALRRAARQERLRIAPTATASATSVTTTEDFAVLSYSHGSNSSHRSHRRRSDPIRHPSLSHPRARSLEDVSAAMDDLLDNVAVCSPTAGRLLLVRLRTARESGEWSAPTPKASRRTSSVNDASVKSGAEFRTIEVLDTDRLLPQEVLGQLAHIARMQTTNDTCQQLPPSPPPRNILSWIDQELGERLLCFPLSRRVFFARCYAVAERWQSTMTVTHQQPPALTLGKLAQLMLWSYEYGEAAGSEMMAAYLARFPTLVQLEPGSTAADAAKGSELFDSRRVIFTVS